MWEAEICRDGVRVSLAHHEEQLALIVSGVSEELPTAELICDPDLLCGVLRGFTYQLSSAIGYCAIRRSGDVVTFDYQAGDVAHRCRLTADEFTNLIRPLLPPRLRAHVL